MHRHLRGPVGHVAAIQGAGRTCTGNPGGRRCCWRVFIDMLWRVAESSLQESSGLALSTLCDRCGT
eukprot:217442-Chlamydomonas_euryale.AAC.2